MEPSVFIYLQFLRDNLLHLPGVTERLCFETPAFYVNNKLFCRIKEDGETLVINTLERDKWLRHNSNIYYVTDHYLNYSYMLIHLDKADPDELKQLLFTAWSNRATKKLIKQYEGNFT
ncbi:MmcQ/YjbR family DNA-binding protein [Mucilaginibacter segetis]|uniref:MmcQ/YjbR family DNA-binding protein n=1 Tax=Mucilaginibacter segetis TaxID=2793071 RepID=A0A934UP07_9SPHI|nr:MmcQ/YjbR family DNA-binding protein [Mucilaginibacter segetis]MBK0380482.1 MmcQ/YjbR family DNA-binding protein [Mucilaginibacter segetis]